LKSLVLVSENSIKSTGFWIKQTFVMGHNPSHISSSQIHRLFIANMSILRRCLCILNCYNILHCSVLIEYINFQNKLWPSVYTCANCLTRSCTLHVDTVLTHEIGHPHRWIRVVIFPYPPYLWSFFPVRFHHVCSQFHHALYPISQHLQISSSWSLYLSPRTFPYV